MILLEAAGLASKEVLTAEDLVALYHEAEAFLAAFGVVLPETWAGLHFAEKEALAAAGRAIRKQQAVDAGMASQGYVQAAQVLSAIDGGAALDAALAKDRREKLLAVAKVAAQRLQERECTVEVRS